MVNRFNDRANLPKVFFEERANVEVFEKFRKGTFGGFLKAPNSQSGYDRSGTSPERVLLWNISHGGKQRRGNPLVRTAASGRRSSRRAESVEKFAANVEEKNIRYSPEHFV
jgi:hypothetical protein